MTRVEIRIPAITNRKRLVRSVSAIRGLKADASTGFINMRDVDLCLCSVFCKVDTKSRQRISFWFSKTYVLERKRQVNNSAPYPVPEASFVPCASLK
jgi:hypothetical protein